MSSKLDLDTEELSKYLQAKIIGFKGPITAQKFTSGQSNPTYRIDAKSGRYVLRRQPLGDLLESAHAVDREYRVIRALADTDVPVPAVHMLCQDNEVIGSMFYIMDFLDGEIYWDPFLPGFEVTQRSRIYEEMNRVLAALHDINFDSVGLGNFGTRGHYCERQLSRWTKQYRNSQTEEVQAMEDLITWLNANLPLDDGRVSLIHGDFRLDNMMFKKGECRVEALLDWELSTLGHPFADLAYQCMQWRIPQDAAIPGLGDVGRKTYGIPTEEEYVEAYCRRRSIGAIENWSFYLAFNFFRLSAILQGVYKRALDGNASSRKALDYGAMAKPLALQGMSLIAQNT